MDSEPDLRKVLENQGALLGRHNQALHELSTQNQVLLTEVTQLSTAMNQLTTRLNPAGLPAPVPAPPPAAPPANRDSYASDPEPFFGDVDKCRGFFLQCSMVFMQRPLTFSTEQSKVHYVMGLLRGRALAWAEAANANQPLTSLTYDDLVSKVKGVFDHPDHRGDAAKRLLNIRQGTKSVADFSVDFRILAADAGWDEPALRGVFVNALSEQMKDELAARDDSTDFDSLVTLAIKLDNRLRERRRERTARPPSSRLPPTPPFVTTRPSLQPEVTEEEPMELGRAHLTPAERSRRLRAGECLYCGKLGHMLAACPTRPKDQAHQ